ncbi:MAG TPA: type 1 glutamine amidotransferase [Candidatus Hydrogenedentes bacterium]|nr:type 1 glutamine amidotransferase [Candidatus Hydrogenedentota bacterium]HOS03681.1 type 1 glutamine amidotransferase [Candidatus Hydrogenedentota bacterium]
MRLHYLQHVPFEDLAAMRRWAIGKGFTITNTLLYEEQPLPDALEIDWLVILGGPMNIYEESSHPWLVREKTFIARCIEKRRVLVGSCLGGQLIADALGGAVRRNEHKEIGWFPVTLTEQGAKSPVFAGFPREFPAFHWHGDTFAVPPGATHAACSAGCEHQAFVYEGRVLGLQFHFEYERASIEDMLVHCEDELDGGPYCQSPAEMRAGMAHVETTHAHLFRMLDNLHAATSGAV